MNEDRAARYHRLERRTRISSLAASGALLGGLILSGGSIGLRRLAHHLAAGDRLLSLGPAVEVAVFVVLLASIHSLLAAPFAFYRGFLLEHRYGLSHETGGRWLRDHLKAALMATGLAVAMSVLIYQTIWSWPSWWWAIAAALFSLLLIGLVNVAPVVLFPRFYRFTPLGRAELQTKLINLAGRAGARVVGAYEWTLSDRTRRANAALAGLGRTRRILISDTLLADYSDEEIEVVLAHELSHHVHRDIWVAMAAESSVTFMALFAASRVLETVGPAAGLAGPGDVAGLPLIILAASAVSLAVTPLRNALSRSHELRADRDALDLTHNPSAFISAMRRLGAQNLAEDRPSRAVELLFFTHPPISKRIAVAKTWAPRTNGAATDDYRPDSAVRRSVPTE